MTRDEILRAAREVLNDVAPARAAELAALLEFPPTGETAAAHVTIAEATLVTAIETMFTAELGERAPEAVANFVKRRAEAYVPALPVRNHVDGRSRGRQGCL